MQFLRENLFLVVLVGVVVVVGAVLLVIELGIAKDVSAELKQRTQTAKDLASLRRRAANTPVNEKILKAREETARRYDRTVRRLEDVHVAWNMRRYRVLSLPVYYSGALLLTADDITDWWGLVAALRADEGYRQQTASHKLMRKHLWDRLPQGLRAKLTAAQVNMPAKDREALTKALIGALNGIIEKQRDFFDEKAFPRVATPGEALVRSQGAEGKDAGYDVVLPEAAARILRKRQAARRRATRPGEEAELSGLDAQRLNRLVLAAFYPDLIRSGHMPAFPIDTELYQRRGLAFNFQQQYHEVLGDLVTQLQATSSPNAVEIQEEVDRWEKLKKRFEEMEAAVERKKAAEKTAAGGGTVGEERGRRLDQGLAEFARIRKMRIGRPKKGTGSEKEDKGIEPKELGHFTAKMRKAREGLIYASPSSFVRVFEPARMVARPPESDLWRAQVGLWIAGDIVEAVIRTNEDVLSEMVAQKKIKPEQRNVLNAPVKQLENVWVFEEVVEERAKGRSTKRRAKPSLFSSEGGGGRREQEAPSELPRANTLTQRTNTRRYDLVPYGFGVIMPTRHLVRLQQNLLALNYHTVLNVSMSKVSDELRREYYYGVDPVMHVQIKAEVPLLARWTRGKWDRERSRWQRVDTTAPIRTDPAAKQPVTWTYGDPLMPVGFLELLGREASATLRPEDENRIIRFGGGEGEGIHDTRSLRGGT